jgi:hypothetical protein
MVLCTFPVHTIALLLHMLEVADKYIVWHTASIGFSFKIKGIKTENI